jgi:hypothetical protein
MKKELLILGLAALLGLQAGPSQAQSVELTMDIFTSSVFSQTTTLLNNNAVMAAARNAEAESRETWWQCSYGQAKREPGLHAHAGPAVANRAEPGASAPGA